MNAPLPQVAQTAVAATPEHAPLYLSCEIALANGSVLGSETFRLVGLEGRERVSEPFEFTLSLHGDTDARQSPLAFSQLLGRPVDIGIGLAMPAGSSTRNVCIRTEPDGSRRSVSIFNGMVAGFGMQEPGVYQLVARPTLWRMTLTNDYRIHAQMTVKAVLEALCRKHGVDANYDGISAPGSMAITRRQDWLQAGESDYEFMRRLMGKAHIYYYFVHQRGKHTLMFCNSASYLKVLDDDRALRYVWTGEDELGLHQWDVVAQYSFQQNMGVSGVRGVFAWQQQAANVNGGVAAYVRFPPENPSGEGELPFHQYRIYQYGGSNDEVKHYTEATRDALLSGDCQLSGASYCPLFRVGHQFRLEPGRYAPPGSQPLQPQLAQASFVLTEVSHRASLDGEYSNQFQAAGAAGLITPLSVADTQQGAVLARVVAHRKLHSPGVWPYYTPDNFDLQTKTMTAPAGSLADARGVLVLLSTDDDKPENYVWVKIPPHLQSIPEVNALVMVSRANDESELPEVQNVHADGSKVVTPDEWTAHSQVGNSYSTSYGDGKSVRFGARWSAADTIEAGEIIEGAYARKLFRDVGYSRGGSFNYSCSEDMALGMLGESWSYGSSYSHSWSKENKSFSAVARVHSESVIGDCDTALDFSPIADPAATGAVQVNRNKIVGNSYAYSNTRGDAKHVSETTGNTTSETTLTGDETSTATRIGNTTTTETRTGDTRSTSHYSGQVSSTSTHDGTVSSTTTHNAKVSNTTTVNADQEITTTINGTHTSTTTQDTVRSATTNGTVHSTETTGFSDAHSTTGQANSLSVQGSNNSLSVVGANNGMSVTGVHNVLEVVGSSNSIKLHGLSTSIDILGAGVSLSVKGAVASLEISGPSIQLPVIVVVM